MVDWSLTSLQLKLIKVGARVVRHARTITFQLAEVAATVAMVRTVLAAIHRLRAPSPDASRGNCSKSNKSGSTAFTKALRNMASRPARRVFEGRSALIQTSRRTLPPRRGTKRPIRSQDQQNLLSDHHLANVGSIIFAPFVCSLRMVWTLRLSMKSKAIHSTSPAQRPIQSLV